MNTYTTGRAGIIIGTKKNPGTRMWDMVWSDGGGDDGGYTVWFRRLMIRDMETADGC